MLRARVGGPSPTTDPPPPGKGSLDWRAPQRPQAGPAQGGRARLGGITSHIEKEEIPGSASGALLHGAVPTAIHTRAILEDLADHAQGGGGCGETDTEAEPGLSGQRPRVIRHISTQESRENA